MIKNIVFFENAPRDIEMIELGIMPKISDYQVVIKDGINNSFAKDFPPEETIVFLDLQLGANSGIDFYHAHLKPTFCPTNSSRW